MSTDRARRREREGDVACVAREFRVLAVLVGECGENTGAAHDTAEKKVTDDLPLPVRFFEQRLLVVRRLGVRRKRRAARNAEPCRVGTEVAHLAPVRRDVAFAVRARRSRRRVSQPHRVVRNSA